LSEAAVDEAFEEFSDSGSLSMRKIGQALNVSAASLYHHFESKQHLLDAVADRGFTVFEKRLRSIEVGAGKPGEIQSRRAEAVIRHILIEYRRFASDHPHLFGLMFVTRREGARRFPRDFAAHRSAVFNLLWNAVEACVTRSESEDTRDHALHLAHDLWALTHGQILLWRAGRFEDEKTFQRVLDRSIERFLATL